MKAFVPLAALMLASLCVPASGEAPTDKRIFVDTRGSAAQAAARLEGQAGRDALLLSRIASAPWLTDGTPETVQAKVRDIVDRAARNGQVPVLVAYNIPFRDCALYSAGGAADGEA